MLKQRQTVPLDSMTIPRSARTAKTLKRALLRREILRTHGTNDFRSATIREADGELFEMNMLEVIHNRMNVT